MNQVISNKEIKNPCKIIEILNENIVKVYEINGIEIKEIEEPILNKKRNSCKIKDAKMAEFIVSVVTKKYSNSLSYTNIIDFWSKNYISVSKGNISNLEKTINNLLDNSIIDVFYLDDLLKELNTNEANVINNLKVLVEKNERSPELEIISNFILNENACIPEVLQQMINKKIVIFVQKKNRIVITIDITFDVSEAKKQLLNLAKKINLDSYLTRFKTKTEEDIIKEVNLKTITDKSSFDNFEKNDKKDIFLVDSNKNKILSNDFMKKIIENGQDTIIFGEKKYGKTTLALLFLLEAKKENYYPIYINLSLNKYSFDEIKEKISNKANFIVFDNFDKLENKNSFLTNILKNDNFSAKAVTFSLANKELKESKKDNFDFFEILKPEISIKWIKNYEDFYIYNKSKNDAKNYYDFMYLYLMNNLLKPKMEKFKTKHKLEFFEDSRVQNLLSKIAINIISEKAKTLTSMNTFLQDGDESFIDTIPEILKIGSLYKQIEFETELFRDFFVTLYLQSTNELDFLMKENNNFKDYKWRNSLLLLSDFIITCREKKFLDNSDLMESILKHLNSEKDIEKMKQIISLTQTNNSLTLKLYSAKMLYRIGNYKESIKLTLDLILLSDKNKWSYLIDLFNNLTSSLSSSTLYDLSLFISGNFIKIIETHCNTLKPNEKEFLELEKFVVRFGGSFARILLLSDLNNFDKAKELFDKKFNFTKNRVGFENEHLRNSSDMIYLSFFEYINTKDINTKDITILEKAFNILEFLNKEYLEKYSIDEFDFNFLFANTNMSYFITVDLDEENKNKLLDILTKIEEKYTLFQSSINREEYKFPLGVIQYNLGKYFIKINYKNKAIEYFEKALENFLSYKKYSYYVNLYLYLIKNDENYKKEVIKICSEIEKEKNDILELFNNKNIIAKLKYILFIDFTINNYKDFSLPQIEAINIESLNKIVF